MNKNKLLFIYLFTICMLLIGCNNNNNNNNNSKTAEITMGTEVSQESIAWENYLYVPTMINKFDDTYFIIDCWNSRILYSDRLSNNLEKWNVLTDSDYLGGHTVASDGELFVFDNTDMQQLLVYKKDGDAFKKVQTISNVCTRPHYVVWDDETKLFYVIGSSNGMLYTFRNDDGKLIQNDVIRLAEIKDSYVRSIVIKDGCLYTVSGPSEIYKYNISKPNIKKYELIGSYKVPAELSGMNQIYPIDNGYLITVNTGESGTVEDTTIVYTENLENLFEKEYVDLYEEMEFVGQPYFISEFDDKYWITEISADRGNGIKSFDIKNGVVSNVETLFYYDEALEMSKERWSKQSQELAKTSIDIIVFMGQSNMSGKGDAAKAPSVPFGWEFRAISDPSTVYPITEPFGLNENNPNGLNDTTEDGQYRKLGGLVSAFANSYYQTAGVPIIAVSASEGNSCIDEWLPGTDFYNDSVNRINLAKSFVQESSNFSLRNVYMVWCQGENDGDNGMSSDEYYNKLKLLTQSLVKDCGVQQNFVIRIGNRADDLSLYHEIQDAQTRLCEDYEYCTMISTSFSQMATDGMMIDIYHYTQEGYNLVGEEAGKNAAEFVLVGK